MWFENTLKGISEMVNARVFKLFPLCSAPLKTLLGGIIEALKINKIHILPKNVF